MERHTSETSASVGRLKACGGEDCRKNNGDCRNCNPLKEALLKLKKYEDSEENNNPALQKMIEDTLIQCQIPMSLVGFAYIVRTLLVMNANPYLKMSDVYRIVGKEMGSYSHLVEVNIKNALVRSKNEENAEVFDLYFGPNLKNTATALKTFLAYLHKEE